MVREITLRLAALMLLLLIGADVLTCETLDTSGAPAMGHCSHRPDSVVHSHCLCCCPHVALPAPIILPALLASREAWLPSREESRRTIALTIYHPPKD